MSALPPTTPAEDPPSPCQKQCKVVELPLDDSDALTRLCGGCGRTIDDIRSWKGMSAQAKRVSIQAAAARRQWLSITGT
ncbi:DUF1289 domain-containing protein [Aquabacterium sp. G14]|uniref:DUF1289 domain-containing protein n=1 Tax=Aquabacterium sp. G14 TaxID=3130164 RepID=UPI0030B689A5